MVINLVQVAIKHIIVKVERGLTIYDGEVIQYVQISDYDKTELGKVRWAPNSEKYRYDK